MRYSLILIGFITILSSCLTSTSDPKKIINSESVTITIKYSGCFGSGIDVITIKNENGQRILTKIYDDKSNTPKKSVHFSKEKEKALSDLIIASKSLPNGMACTTESKYIIHSEKYKYIFEDHSCSLHEYLDELTN